MATVSKAKDVKVINVPALQMEEIILEIEGTAPLIVNRFGLKSQRQIEDKILKKAKVGREAKDPEAEYQDSLYKFSTGRKTGFPAVGFKGAISRAAKLLGLVMVDTRIQFFVVPDDITEDGTQLVEIKGKHEKHKSFPRVANGNPDLRFRAIYKQWGAQLRIRYNAAFISSEQIANLVNMSGLCGIGEWRPEKSNTGAYGTYQLKSTR